MARPNADILGDLEHRLEDARNKFSDYGYTLRQAGDRKKASTYEWVSMELDRLYDELEDLTNNFINDTAPLITKEDK